MIGTVINDRYRLDAELGRGGMGIVYRAHDLLLDRDVAAKVLVSPALGTEGRARLLREARAAAQLNHPNILSVHDAGEIDRLPYIIMELVDGESPLTYCQQDVDKVLAVAQQVCAALDHAHAHGIIHRDLKPENVMVTSAGQAKLTDFGLARSAASRLTTEDTVVGTVFYLAPEQALGQETDGRADLYALGVMLYELTTGRLPFTADNPVAVISQHLHAPVVPPSSHNPAIPPGLDSLIVRLMSKKPEDRPASAAAVGEELANLRSGVGRGPVAAPRTSWRIHLPQELTPFVGRERELARIAERLADPDCRLLTLVGPGGSGKTRLAIEAAAAYAEGLEHGAAFVSLAPLSSAEAIVPTVAEALGFRFYDRGETGGGAKVEPKDQLLDYLRRKRLLLVMDNYEHLLVPAGDGRKDGAGLVSEILQAAPGVKVLATSRARLNVGGEQRFQVVGMDYPTTERFTAPASILADAETYSAVQLFLQCARRALPGFELTEETLGGVVEVCRLVDGLPLAIRLAAAWLAMLSPAEIAAEIGRGLDLLETDVRDVPERQRSMRAVLDHSWKILTRRERELMAALSVFRGGWTREAAEAVTGATLRDLMGLVNQSLVHPTAKGRYEMHELTRAYAAERLAAESESWQLAHDRHAGYYTAALGEWEADLKCARQEVALAEMDQEIENARAAWEWAAGRRQVGRLRGALEGLCWYYLYRRRFEELESACRLATEALEEAASGNELGALARLFAWQGWTLPYERDRALMERSMALLERPELDGRDIRRDRALALGRMGVLTGVFDLAQASELCEESLALYRELGDAWWVARTMWRIGRNAELAGGPRAAKPWALESLRAFKALGDPRGTAMALELLTLLDAFAGRTEECERWADEYLAICQEIGDRYYLATGIKNRGIVHWYSGEFVQAQSLFEEAAAILDDLGVDDDMVAITLTDAAWHLGQYETVRTEAERRLAIVREWGWPQGLGEWLLKLGAVAVAAKAYRDAETYLREAVVPLRDTGLVHWLGSVLAMLGVAHRGLEEHSLAEECLLEALRLAAPTDYFFLQVTAVSAAALYLAGEGQERLAVELYALASRYPMVERSRWFEDVFGQEMAGVAATLPAKEVAAAQERGRGRDLGETVAELVVEMGGEANQ